VSDLAARTDWCLLLGNACSPSFPDAACQALEAMLPLLADWNDSYFSIETARDIACAKRRQIIPALEEIVLVFRTRDRARVTLARPARVLRIFGPFEPPTPEQRAESIARARQVIAELRAGMR
jgi:hypothetical protein